MEALHKVLIVDDFFGRDIPGELRVDRLSVCRRLGLAGAHAVRRAHDQEGIPFGVAHFIRGQKPARAKVGDTIENDLDGVMTTACSLHGSGNWSVILLDLCFRTGVVTPASHREFFGFPEGRPEDDRPSGLFGLRILKELQARKCTIPVVIFSGIDQKEVITRVNMFSNVIGWIPRDAENAREKLVELMKTRPERTHIPSLEHLCDDLVAAAEAHDFGGPSELESTMLLWRRTTARMMRVMLRSSLVRTRKIRNEPALQPAVRLLEASAGGSTAKAADFLKRLLRECQPFEDVLLEDPLVHTACKKAFRLRGDLRPKGQ